MQINLVTLEDVESLQSLQEGGQECPAHPLSTLSLPRRKLKLVHAQGRGVPVYSKIFNSGGGQGGREDRNTRR